MIYEDEILMMVNQVALDNADDEEFLDFCKILWMVENL